MVNSNYKKYRNNVFSTIFILVFCFVGLACNHAEELEQAVSDATASALAECDPVKAELSRTQDDLETTAQALESARQELTDLKQTPQYYFDQIVAVMHEGTDDEDPAVITAFRQFVDRFPDDPLVEPARVLVTTKNRLISNAPHRRADI